MASPNCWKVWKTYNTILLFFFPLCSCFISILSICPLPLLSPYTVFPMHHYMTPLGSLSPVPSPHLFSHCLAPPSPTPIRPGAMWPRVVQPGSTLPRLDSSLHWRCCSSPPMPCSTCSVSALPCPNGAASACWCLEEGHFHPGPQDEGSNGWSCFFPLPLVLVAPVSANHEAQTVKLFPQGEFGWWGVESPPEATQRALPNTPLYCHSNAKKIVPKHVFH
jgi:hypothetical protein